MAFQSVQYRDINFRDGVLWPLAYALGLDPTKELLSDQAAALVTYINSWFRKSWDSTDWPEWTLIRPFTPDANHIVPYLYTSASGDFQGSYTISRVFKVYLTDPHLSQGSYDTGFRLMDDGIHCGFEHGTTVWIKFIVTLTPFVAGESAPAAGPFTSDEWDPSRTYALGELTYSPSSGECYVNFLAGNIGQDPNNTDPLSPWAEIFFPFALVDIVLRGAYADCLKEWGQNEKAAASEQLAIEEGKARAATFLGPPYDRLTDQTQPKPRYTVP